MATTVQNNYTVPASTKEDEVKKNIDLNEKEKKLYWDATINNNFGFSSSVRFDTPLIFTFFILGILFLWEY